MFGLKIRPENFGWVLHVIDACIPKTRTIVLFTFPDGDDQAVAICLALQKANWRGRLVWLVLGEPDTFAKWSLRRGLTTLRPEFIRKYSWGGFWAFLRAKWVFYTHGVYLNYEPPRGKTVVNMWHGMPIKKIWRGVPGASVPPQSSMLLSTSPFFSNVLMRASGFGWEKLLESGLPRNDFLREARPEAVEYAARLRGKAEKLILFFPTYRKSKIGFITNDGWESGQMLCMSSADEKNLRRWLAANRCKLVIKPHPMSIHEGGSLNPDEYLEAIDDKALLAAGVGLYELLGQADLLITDVSSICVDFLITGRAQIFYFPDRDQYKNNRGLLFEPLEDYMPGPITNSYQELEVALADWRCGTDAFLEKRVRLTRLLIPIQSGSAAEQVLAATGVIPNPGGGGVDLPTYTVAAVVWAQFGPYHFARARQLREVAKCLRILPVEIGSRSQTYAWSRTAESPELATLFPGANAEKISPFRIFFRALKYFNDSNVSLVFVTSYWPGSSLAILLAARFAGARAVMMNETHALTAQTTILRVVAKRVILFAFNSALVGGSPHKKYFCDLGFDAGKIFDGYDAIDNAFFSNRAAECRALAAELRGRYHLPDRYFLNVGRMEPKKNLECLVTAYAKAKQGQANFARLVFVGGGSEEQRLKIKCGECGLTYANVGGSSSASGPSSADVLFYGFRQIDELPVFYSLAQAFILPSVREEWGLVVNEAMASGIPVIVSSVAGCAPDLVMTGQTGFTFAPSNATELADILRRMNDDPILATRMGRHAAEHIAQWGLERFARNAILAAKAAIEPVH